MSFKRYIKVLGALAAVLAFSAVGAGAAQAANDAPHFTVTETVGGVSVTNFAATAFTGVSTGSTVSGKPGGLGKLEVRVSSP
jgi:hypothetical protein